MGDLRARLRLAGMLCPGPGRSETGEQTKNRDVQMSDVRGKGRPPTAVGGSTGGGWQPTARCCWWLTDRTDGYRQRLAVN